MPKSPKDTFGMWTTLFPETMSSGHPHGEPMKILIEPKMDVKTANQINAKPTPGYSAVFGRSNGWIFDLDSADWPPQVKSKAKKVFEEHRMIWRITSEMLEEDQALKAAEKKLDDAKKAHQESYKKMLKKQGMGVPEPEPEKATVSTPESPKHEEPKPDNK